MLRLIPQQNRLELWILAAVDGNQATLFRMIGRREQLDVRVRDSGSLEACGHALRGQRAVAGGQCRIGLDQFSV
jgi:hypothetical protein